MTDTNVTELRPSPAKGGGCYRARPPDGQGRDGHRTQEA